MNRFRNLLAAAALLAAQMPSPGQAQTEYLKVVPKEGEIPLGKVVYVDDGTCPRGEVKEITGGSRSKAIPRTTRCVARSAGSSAYDGRYAGLMTCDIVPGLTTRPLRVEFMMTVAGGKAAYEREVLRPDSRERLGVTERGAGAVSRDGELTLTGYAEGRTWSYAGSYRGLFDGKYLRLAGTQVWILPNNASHNRPCSIDVTRAE
jgi:hypothetical protein